MLPLDLENVNIEFGLERKMKTKTILKQNQVYTLRKVSPLQYACSLGLFRIVEMLLEAGADPNGPPYGERNSMIDYGDPPLIISMRSKHHKKDLEIDGLAYKRNFSKENDVDYF